MLLTTSEYAPAPDRSTMERLLIDIAAGEQEALAELYHRTKAAVYGMALSYLHNTYDAQVELDDEDGVPVYEVSFQFGDMEYEYKIHAATSEILKHEAERDD